MARPGITYHDIANAAEQITAQGNHPTIERIRLITGTGSSSTIAQHLRIWREKQTQARHLLSEENVPEEIAITVKGLWERVLNQADEKVTEIKQELDQTIATVKEQNQKLEEDNKRWQQQYHQLKQEKADLDNDKAALEINLKNLENEKIALTVENDNIIKQLQERQERIDELHRLNRQMQANLEHYYEASREQRMLDQQSHEQAQTQLVQTIHQLKQQLTEVNTQNNSLQQELEQIRYANNTLRDEHDQFVAQHDIVKSKLDQVQKEAIEHAYALEHSQNQYRITEKKSSEQNAEISKLQSMLALIAQKLSDTQGDLKEINEQNKFLTHERWVLGQENAQLVGQLKQFEKLWSNVSNNLKVQSS